jgi:hypothetical protein
MHGCTYIHTLSTYICIDTIRALAIAYRLGGSYLRSDLRAPPDEGIQRLRTLVLSALKPHAFYTGLRPSIQHDLTKSRCPHAHTNRDTQICTCIYVHICVYAFISCVFEVCVYTPFRAEGGRLASYPACTHLFDVKDLDVWQTRQLRRCGEYVLVGSEVASPKANVTRYSAY